MTWPKPLPALALHEGLFPWSPRILQQRPDFSPSLMFPLTAPVGFHCVWHCPASRQIFAAQVADCISSGPFFPKEKAF